PGCDGATFQGQPLVGNDLFEIHARGAAESLAGVAGAERRVVGEQSRLRRTQFTAASVAAHALAESYWARAAFEGDLPDSTAEAPRRRNRLGGASAILERQSIGYYRQLAGARPLVERTDALAVEKAHPAVAPQHFPLIRIDARDDVSACAFVP